MKVGLWAEIRRLKEIEKLSHRAIARRLGCCAKTVKKALALERPPDRQSRPASSSLLDPYKPRIDALLDHAPELSAVRVLEEIRRGEEGYPGGISLVRRYLRQVRPPRGRIYQEVDWQPGEALQVDWGACGRIRLGNTSRRVSVFVAVLCYSRLCYLEFSLAERKTDFYRALVHALEFFGGTPRKVIFDNLKAAVLNGSGRAACLHPEFLALCGHYYLEAVPCARRDPESKGMVEAGVRYVKHNALAGRQEELTRWENYAPLAVYWRDQVANVRLHDSTRERPVERFEKERSLLRPLPTQAFDTDVPTSGKRSRRTSAKIAHAAAHDASSSGVEPRIEASPIRAPSVPLSAAPCEELGCSRITRERISYATRWRRACSAAGPPWRRSARFSATARRTPRRSMPKSICRGSVLWLCRGPGREVDDEYSLCCLERIPGASPEAGIPTTGSRQRTSRLRGLRQTRGRFLHHDGLGTALGSGTGSGAARTFGSVLRKTLAATKCSSTRRASV